MTNLEKIRQACIAANPEIMELKFGCWIKHKKDEEIERLVGEVGTYNRNPDDGSTQTCFCTLYQTENDYIDDSDDEGFEILGRELTLVDVLLALGNKHDLRDFIRALIIDWNLTKGIEDQTQETIDFIASLLPDNQEKP